MFFRDSDGMLIMLSQALLNYDTLDAETKSLVDERMKGYKDPQESIPFPPGFHRENCWKRKMLRHKDRTYRTGKNHE
jgi:hypothetical protein